MERQRICCNSQREARFATHRRRFGSPCKAFEIRIGPGVFVNLLKGCRRFLADAREATALLHIGGRNRMKR